MFVKASACIRVIKLFCTFENAWQRFYHGPAKEEEYGFEVSLLIPQPNKFHFTYERKIDHLVTCESEKLRLRNSICCWSSEKCELISSPQ